MNTLPNLNAAPIAPAAPTPARPSYLADPQQVGQSQSQSFTQALTKEVADRRAAANNDNQVKPNTANTQNAQNAQNTQNTQSTQNAQNNQDGSTVSADAKTDGKDDDKTESDADKASSDLLALVASVADVNLAPQQQAAAVTATPIAAPVTAQIVPTGLSARDGDANAAPTQALPDALEAKTNKGGKQAAKPGAGTLKAEADPAAADNDAAATTADKSGETAAASPNAGLASARSADAKPAFDLQAMTATQTQNNNAAFNPGLHQVTGAALQAPAASDKLTPPVGSPAWDQALGQKVVWMTGNGQQSATLTLNPPDLGPMQVVINVNKTQADATFIAATPEVKQALEAAMPKLREMLDQAGIQLGQSNVSTGMPNQQQQAFNQPQRGGSGGGAGSGAGGGGAGGSDGTASSAVAPAAGGSSGQGLVDTFV